jgi:hypothetical protein
MPEGGGGKQAARGIFIAFSLAVGIVNELQKVNECRPGLNWPMGVGGRWRQA